MIQIDGLDEGLEIFKTLGSEVRLKIVELLSENGEMNLNELAAALDVTNGAVTSHVRKLEECGIIRVEMRQTARGKQKVCSLKEWQLLFNEFASEEERTGKIYETEVKIGLYSDYSAGNGCGMAGTENMIGAENDARCFAYPERVDAELIWLHDGFIEYRIPNLLPEHQRITQLTLSFEISSGDQALESDTQSVIHFLLNGRNVGEWLSVRTGDTSRGIYTPLWWDRHERQYGYLKMIVINAMGAYLDGVKVADTGFDWGFTDENGEMKLRFEVHPENGHEGGLALYGANFGNYKHGIRARVHYMPEETWNG